MSRLPRPPTIYSPTVPSSHAYFLSLDFSRLIVSRPVFLTISISVSLFLFLFTRFPYVCLSTCLVLYSFLQLYLYVNCFNRFLVLSFSLLLSICFVSMCLSVCLCVCLSTCLCINLFSLNYEWILFHIIDIALELRNARSKKTQLVGITQSSAAPHLFTLSPLPAIFDH